MDGRRPARTPGDRGMSLLELVAVMSVLILFAAALTPAVSKTAHAKRKRASVDCARIAEALAAYSRDVTGQVTAPAGSSAAGTTVTFADGDGTVRGSATLTATGSIDLGGLPAVNGTLSVVPPSGLLVDGPTQVAVDLRTSDAVVDLALRAPVPVTASGRVVDTGGAPVPGATVTLTDGTTTLTTTTATDGTWTSPALGAGTWTVTVTAPAGWTVVSAAVTLTVDEADESAAEPVEITLDSEPVEVEEPAGTDATATPQTGSTGTEASGALAATGADPRAHLAGAAGFVGLGILLVAAARPVPVRRRGPAHAR